MDCKDFICVMQLMGLASHPPQAKLAEPPLHKKEGTEKAKTSKGARRRVSPLSIHYNLLSNYDLIR
jgi:hypothetical protein